MTGDLRHLYTPEFVERALSPTALVVVTLVSLVGGIAGYLARSGSLYWLFYVTKRDAWHDRKIQPAWPTRDQIANEIKWSLRSCLTFTVMTPPVYIAAVKGWTRLYLNVSDRGWGYFFLSIVLMLCIHDAYFYWIHWLSHRSRWLFRHVHRVHHMSRNPTPFADIMFHPVDALLHAGWFPLFLFTLPLHPAAFALFFLLVTAVNAIGHVGYELLPERLEKLPLLRLISRATLHNVHHSHVHCNFGLYFRVWDQLLGTERDPAALKGASPPAEADGGSAA